MDQIEIESSILNSDSTLESNGAYSAALQEIAQLKAQQQESNLKIKNLEEEILRLKEQLLLMQHRRFGKKSEAGIGEPIAQPATLEKTVAVSAHKRQPKKSRLIDINELPRYQIYHDLSEEERICSDCRNQLDKIGEETATKLEIIPARLYLAEHIRYKYCCRSCQTLKMAPKPRAPVPKAIAGASLLTEVAIGKYEYHLPIYRQSKMLAGFNVHISDSTIGNWIYQAGLALMPIYQALWEVVLKTRYLQVDETPVQVLKARKKGYLWAYLAPTLGKGLVIFELSLTRSGSVAEDRLAQFRGLLQTDGSGYQNLRDRKGILGLGCLTHARRPFADVLKITQNKDGIAAEFIERVKPLYALEEKMRERAMSYHTRKRLRQKKSWPILKSLHRWLKIQKTRIPPKTKLGLAIQYTLNQWRYIIAYVRHGTAEIDTNMIENLIRPTALGKKNWLFMSDEDSGLVHALWYSLILSAVRNGLNCRVYINYLLTNVHKIRQGLMDPKTLLPHSIDMKILEAFSAELIANSKKVMDNT